MLTLYIKVHIHSGSDNKTTEASKRNGILMNVTIRIAENCAVRVTD